MPFPESDRVIYAKNPLEFVICQVRFPTILRITSSPPVEFQEELRDWYPEFKEEQSYQLAPVLPHNVLSKLLEASPAAQASDMATKKYVFTSEDGDWTLSLARDFLALECRNYTRWEVFKDMLKKALDALVAIYKPKHFSRIGLRYRDVIVRSRLDLIDESWSSLLQPHVLGEMASDVGDAVIGSKKETLYRLNVEDSVVRVQHGQAQTEQEETYIIDSDFFTGSQQNVDRAWELLECFRLRSGWLFRWFITAKLHDSMEPTAP